MAISAFGSISARPPFHCCSGVPTGVALEVNTAKLHNLTTGEVHELKLLGDVAPILEAGGLFPYAAREGLLRGAKLTRRLRRLYTKRDAFLEETDAPGPNVATYQPSERGGLHCGRAARSTRILSSRWD